MIDIRMSRKKPAKRRMHVGRKPYVCPNGERKIPECRISVAKRQFGMSFGVRWYRQTVEDLSRPCGRGDDVSCYEMHGERQTVITAWP